MTTFDSFSLPPALTQALHKLNFTAPTPIQEQAIPMALQGRDIMGTAQTGTGKTAAFALPTLAHLIETPGLNALVLLPTRELAAQVEAAVQSFCQGAGLRTALLIGGDSMQKQLRQLQANPRFIIGTPGRVNDHLKRGTLRLNKSGILILDETDRMLDMGFGHQIETIINKMPQQRQTLMFSATLPPEIQKLSSRYLSNPVRIAIGTQHKPTDNVEQTVIKINDDEKYTRLCDELYDRKGSVIVFVKTKFGAERLAKRLHRDDHKSDSLHGDLPQRRRERVISGFRDKNYRVLVATDIAARGLDIPHIEHVINYDLPQSPEDFIHRIGRTGRAGAKGHAISFVSPAENRKWVAIDRLLNPDRKPEPRAAYKDGGKPGAPQKKRRYGKRMAGKGPSRGGFGGKKFRSKAPSRSRAS